jgi:hypothetical protein
MSLFALGNVLRMFIHSITSRQPSGGLNGIASQPGENKNNPDGNLFHNHFIDQKLITTF